MNKSSLTQDFLWLWRGDYYNMGSGAEIGLYKYDYDLLGEAVQYKVVDFMLPMSLNLYNYDYGYDHGRGKVKNNIFCWKPEEKQWWTTGFNYEFYEPDVKEMVSLGTVDFEGHEGMFEALKAEVQKTTNKAKDFMIFDEDDGDHIAWFIWWGAQE